ncbi:MAG: glycosyltransferase, partial [Kiritimatiellae bacterium]|nr:glycosyltransferase [Kiritimatiellia bacterium]
MCIRDRAHTHPGTDARARHPVRRFVERLCYRAVSDVIFNSNAVKEEWRRKLRCRAIRGRVIWYGLPEPPSQEQVDYPPRPFDTVDFVCVSRFVRWKGHRELLQAWFLAQQAVKSRIRLLLVGDGPTLPEMQHLVSRLGLGNSVLFCGARPDGAAFFARADVGVQLSVEPEAFGFVLLEAMCRQRPVIASRLGGITEVVEHEETGLLVNPHDPQTVVRAICRLAESPELRRTMGQRGYERWRRHFTLERMVTEYAGYLESIP